MRASGPQFVPDRRGARPPRGAGAPHLKFSPARFEARPSPGKPRSSRHDSAASSRLRQEAFYFSRPGRSVRACADRQHRPSQAFLCRPLRRPEDSGVASSSPMGFKAEALEAGIDFDTGTPTDFPLVIHGKGQLVYWKGCTTVVARHHDKTEDKVTQQDGQGTLPSGTRLLLIGRG
ncbi:hypothetical protein BDY21DRAFT_143956 [Lineolata rhizophorae]|uniref:Uncharacterized protein n=1 Tax=Lineolata rhizophorae TaxID=578093 RepID=A0A6A6NNG1_9PEZI|nr:hypothetical protein BDY21DRAFT_143956 [Lineolata rhizophorae]